MLMYLIHWQLWLQLKGSQLRLTKSCPCMVECRALQLPNSSPANLKYFPCLCFCCIRWAVALQLLHVVGGLPVWMQRRLQLPDDPSNTWEAYAQAYKVLLQSRKEYALTEFLEGGLIAPVVRCLWHT